MAKANPSNKKPASSSETARRLRKTREDNAAELAQDYVEAIAELSQGDNGVRVVDLAAHLGVSHVTVVRTIGRLKRAGLVKSDPYRPAHLTTKGRKLAEQCRRRHQLVLEFLRSLGIPETTAQLDAEGIEHHVSAETLKAFKRHLAATRGKD